MDEQIDIPILLAKLFITLLLLFAFLCFLTNFDDLIEVTRYLGLGFLLISSSIILFKLYRSFDLQTVVVAAVAAAAINILFYSSISGHLCLFFLRIFNDVNGANALLIANLFFWLS